MLQTFLGVCSGSFSMANANLQFSCTPREGKTLYLGVGAAVSNLTGYGAALLGAFLQSNLMVRGGIGSVRVLFFCSGVLCLIPVLFIIPRLPRIVPGEE